MSIAKKVKTFLIKIVYFSKMFSYKKNVYIKIVFPNDGAFTSHKFLNILQVFF